LEHFDKVNVFEPKNTFALKIHGGVKQILHDCLGALQDLDKVNVLQPNNAFPLRIRERIEYMLDDY
jgi:hypothetical protein